MTASTNPVEKLRAKAAELGTEPASIRLLAVARLLEKENPNHVAAALDIHPATLSNWKKIYSKKGMDGLTASKRGRKDFLNIALDATEPDELKTKLSQSVRDAWKWLNKEHHIYVSISTVHTWKRKLLKTGDLL